MLNVNQNTVKNNKFVKSLKNFANSNFVAKIIIAIIIWAVALIPTWIYIITRLLIDPAGFWQELALFCIFAIVIGWLQAILAIFGGVITIRAIFDKM